MAPRRRSGLVSALAALLSDGEQDAVLAGLRRAILQGYGPPGSEIPVDQVAEVFGVSRIPVREALRTLIGEGLVDHVPRSGYTVTRLTAQEFREIYVVRGILERAALSGAMGEATSADDTECQEAVDALDAALAADDLAAYHRESRRFHFALLAPARMPRLFHMIESAWNVTEPCRPMAYVSGEERAALHSDHAVMLSAFIARDLPALLTVADRHQARLERSISAVPTHTGLFAPAEAAGSAAARLVRLPPEAPAR